MPRVFRTPDHYFYAIETGQPEQPVRIGQGATIRAAIRDLSDTPIQSAGRAIEASERAYSWLRSQDGSAPEWDDLEEVDHV